MAVRARFYGLLGSLLGMGHFGVTLGLLWNHFVIIVKPFWGHFGSWEPVCVAMRTASQPAERSGPTADNLLELG